MLLDVRGLKADGAKWIGQKGSGSKRKTTL